MKIRTSIAVLTALTSSACTEIASITMPESPDFEIVDGHGVQVQDGNVTIFAQFGFTDGQLSVDGYSGPGLNEDGKALGTCQFGRWKNPAGRFAGSVPHPHCVRAVGLHPQADVVSMETITGRHALLPGNVPVKLVFANEGLAEENRVQYQTNQDRTQGTGLIVAHALRNGVRSGKFVFDLGQFEISGENLLEGRCYVGAFETNQEADSANWRYCLNYEVGGQLRGAAIAHYYADVAADHSDPSRADRVVNGFIYWK